MGGDGSMLWCIIGLYSARLLMCRSGWMGCWAFFGGTWEGMVLVGGWCKSWVRWMGHVMGKLLTCDGHGLIMDGIWTRDVLWMHDPFVWTKRSTCGLLFSV